METYIHIGLPKCASTFLQEKFFKLNKSDEILYNPDEIFKLINKIDPRKIGDNKISEIEDQIKDNLSKLNCKKLILSHEGLSGGNFNLDYETNLKTIKKFFPNAKIILVLRFQTDLLFSLYYQMVEQGRCRYNIDYFFNKNNINKINLLNLSSYKFSIDTEKYDYVNYLKNLFKIFDKNLHILFFENFRDNKKLFIKNLAEYMKLEKIPENFNYVNKSLSNKSIKILIIVHKISSLFGFSIPYQKNNKYNYMDKDNLNSIDVFWCWKNLVYLLRKYLEPFIREKTDKKMLDLKNELDKIYKNKNKKLKEILKDKLPDIYI